MLIFRRRDVIVLAVLMGVALLVLKLTQPDGDAPAPSAPGPDAATAAAPDAGRPEEPAPAPPPAQAAEAAPGRAPAPEETAYAFCPDEAASAPDLQRPSFVDPINLRTAELIDRARSLDESASEELAAALTKLFGQPPAEDEAIANLMAAPDRLVDGFDYAVAATVLCGVRALSAGRPSRAADLATAAATAAPDDPVPELLRALAAERMDDPSAARRALARAFALDSDPAVGMALGLRLSSSDDLALTLSALDAYLEAYPQDVAVGGLRRRLGLRADMVASFQRTERDGVVVLADPSVDRAVAEDVLATVVSALSRAAHLLGVPRRPEQTVFIYGSRTDMLAATCVQSWTRGAYDGALHFDGEALGDPRTRRTHVEHECLHAALDAAVPGAPLWLHEGLAQHFAGQRSPAHDSTYRMMVAQHTYVPFASLDGSFQVIEDSEDAGLAYHQSLAMVELMIARGGERALADAVAYLRAGGDPAGLLAHVAGRPLTGDDLLDFLARREGVSPAPR